MTKQNFKNQDTALLVMDIQEFTVNLLSNSSPFLDAVNKSIQTARNNKIPVIYAVIGFRKAFPEISTSNKAFSELKNSGFKFDEQTAKVARQVAPQSDDIIVTKKRVSAFSGSDLELILSSLGIKHLVLTGIATSGVVLSTLREAADKDYVLTVLSDNCADRDEEVHRILMTKLFPKQADVITSEEWAQLFETDNLYSNKAK